MGSCAGALAALAPVFSCAPPESPARAATVFYASGADLQSINPLVAVHPLAKAVQKHVLFLTLASYDSTLSAVPRLAIWSWDARRTELTFRLRREVRWHDGTPTTAHDVAWTLAMARAPAVAFPRARDLADVRDVTVLDSFRLRVRFTRTQPTFPDVFTDLAILPAHRLQGVSPHRIRSAEFNRAPVGNGPFAFREYRPNQRWVFARRADFPEALGRPAVERLVVAVVSEPATKLAALTSGELDFAGIAPAHAAFVREDPALRVLDYPVLLVAALVWNLRRPPFDDPRVRRALAMALDRREIVEGYLYGFGEVAAGPVNPGHPWFEPVAPVPHDAEAAARLLGQAGYGPDGRRLAFDLLTVGSGDNALEQMIQAHLARVNVAVRIRRLELSTFLEVAQGPARDFDALVTLIPGDLSLGFVSAMFRGDGPLAYPGYRSPAFDATVARVGRATTAAEREAAWREAQRILAAEHPTTWIYHARGLQGASRRFRNVRIDLRGELATISAWRIASGNAP